MVTDGKTGLVGRLSIGDHECVVAVLPRDGGVQQIGPGDGDVLDPHQHVKIESSPLLKLEAVRIGENIFLACLVSVAKDLGFPTVAAATSQITAGDLLQDVCNVHGNIGDVFPVLLSDMVNEWGKRECPFIGTNGEEGGKPELTNCTDDVKVLVLPKRA